MRFIHSSDLQIGMVFNYFEPDAAAALKAARQAVVRTVGETAVKYRAAAVLLAGDIYDRQQPSSETLRKPIEAMRQFPRIAWHLMPGNHDHARENGLWDSVRRLNLPENVHLHTTPGVVELPHDDGTRVSLLPAPLRYLASDDDLTAYMDAAPTPDGAIRIGMAHGSIRGFGAEGEAKNYVAPNRAERAGLAYLAMGDWHRQIRVNDRTWYSGTPEPDRFKLPPDAGGTLCNGGSALLVEILGAHAPPVVTPVPTAQYVWHQISETLTDDSQIDVLEARLRGLDRNLARIVLDLRVIGTLSLTGRAGFEERIVRGVGSAICGMRFDGAGLLHDPTEAEMDEIDRSGFIRVAADRLKAMANDPVDPEQARLALLALRRLYLEHLHDGASL